MNENVGSRASFHHHDVEAVPVVDGLPVGRAGGAQRVHSELQARGPDRIHVDDVAQVLDVGREQVLSMGGRAASAR